MRSISPISTHLSAAALLLSALGACGTDAPAPATPSAQAPASAASADTEAAAPAAAEAADHSTTDEPAATDSGDDMVSSQAMSVIFDTPVKTLDGKPSKLGDHRGKALLVVNVASKCGLTPQYEGLEKLHEEYAARGFSVVGFPCNQFGGQEPGTAEEIKEFCSLTYGVTFPMFEKIEVNGDDRHPIYQELTQVADAEGTSGDIRWNFEKFVISADGSEIKRFSPRVEPYDPSLIAAIEAALPQE